MLFWNMSSIIKKVKLNEIREYNIRNNNHPGYASIFYIVSLFYDCKNIKTLITFSSN